MRIFIGFAALAIVLVTAGCGSGTGDTSEAIPASVASDLAAQSESIADALDAGDECGAAHRADDLRHAADEAIASGSIPAAYRSDLETAVTNLQTIVNCPPPDKNNPGHEDEGHGPGKPKGHDKHDGPPSVTTTGTTAGEGD